MWCVFCVKHSPIIPFLDRCRYFCVSFCAGHRGSLWGGADSNEWSDVKNSELDSVRKPLSVIEGGLGYYNLMKLDIRKRQADLARRAGVSGFVFHHYW
jgi:hypothetical protein